MYGAADLRIENVPDPAVIEPTEGPFTSERTLASQSSATRSTYRA